MELKVLHRHGWTVSQLAREFGISRTTVYKELASGTPRRYAERTKPTALNEAQVMHIERRLAVCPDIRGTILHDELRQGYGYQGSYVAFERHLRPLRPAQVKDPEIRFETDPGWQTGHQQKVISCTRTAVVSLLRIYFPVLFGTVVDCEGSACNERRHQWQWSPLRPG
jgi:transposase